MALLARSRSAAVARLYHRAALVYVVLGLLVLAMSRLVNQALAPSPADAPAPATPWQELALPVGALVVATAIIWRGHRKLAVVLMFERLYRAVVYALAGLGQHFALGPEQSWSDLLADPASAVPGLIGAERATATPFYELASIPAAEPFALADALAAWPVPEPVVDAVGEVVVAAQSVALAQAVLLALVVLMLRRATRYA